MKLSDYKFSGVPKPFEHQIETTKFIVEHDRCFVFNDIGTGKTWSAVWAIDYLMQTDRVRNVLIVAPLSTLEIVWQRTFFYLDGALNVEVLKGTASKRNSILGRHGLLQDRGIVSIINPDALHIIQDNRNLAFYDLILVDESAMFRNAKSRRFKALAKICSDKSKRVVCMTGSPCPEAPTDIWSTARIVCPERVPKYFGQFRDMTMRKISMFKWAALPSAQETITRLLKGYVVRYRRDECIDLPESQSVTYETVPTPQQKRAITEMRKAAIAMFDEGNVTAPNEAVVISKILQIASGAVKFNDSDGNPGVKEIDCKSKFDALQEIIDASTQPVIIYAPYTAAIKRLATFFSDVLSYKIRLVEGSTPMEKRKEAFDDLQAGRIRILIAHPQAVAHGLTLTNSNVIIWFCPIFSHEIFEQANGRIVRPGQTRKTYIVTLVCSDLEKKVMKRLESKAQLQGSLLEYLQTSNI